MPTETPARPVRSQYEDLMRHVAEHGVFKADQLATGVRQLCDLLVANGPSALAECKALIRRVARAPLDDALVADTAARIARIRVGAEGREGIASFLEKRKARWEAGGPT